MGLLSTKELSKGQVLIKQCPRSCLATTVPSGCGQGRTCSPYIRHPGLATLRGGADAGPEAGGAGSSGDLSSPPSCSDLSCCCFYPVGGPCSALVSGGPLTTP